MATTIRAEAVRWFVSKFGDKSNAIYTSKFYIPERSWTRQSAWWIEIPPQKIESPESGDIFLLCQTAPNTKDFHCLIVPVAFLKEELPYLCVRKDGRVSLFLCADPLEMFVDKRGKRNVSFKKLFKPTNPST